ncbi:hypothetical protein HDU87_005507 [Geranomyces variabilis]|uniref:Uncharacterized protein n=1 Tax=Geranomyces variabilis TaxID=109894 RepID=A0AAD5TGS6_9FUNG|nr:hypothetical protein HDU87_005507 [Geranomyces variabilis]
MPSNSNPNPDPANDVFVKITLPKSLPRSSSLPPTTVCILRLSPHSEWSAAEAQIATELDLVPSSFALIHDGDAAAAAAAAAVLGGNNGSSGGKIIVRTSEGLRNLFYLWSRASDAGASPTMNAAFAGMQVLEVFLLPEKASTAQFLSPSSWVQ